MKTLQISQKHFFALALLLLGFCPSVILSQNNAVRPSEGEVAHTFTEGLVLPPSMASGSYLSAQDMVAWLYATKRFTTPKAGDSLSYSYPQSAPVIMPPRDTARQQSRLRRNNNPGFGGRFNFQMSPRWRWTEIKADSTGAFSGGNIRGSYLYTTYSAPQPQIVILEASGNQRTFVNGLPHEGDYYGFDWSIVPVKLKKGVNEFVYTPGRAGRVKARLIVPEKPVQLTKRDLTLPDLLIGETQPAWGAVRIVNASEQALKGLRIRATLPTGESASYNTDNLLPLSVRKCKFHLPALPASVKEQGETEAIVELLDKTGRVLDTVHIALKVASPNDYHTRTFVSQIEGSVQFFSVSPAIRKDLNEIKALTLTVHGANVDAHVQAGCYSRKPDMDIVAATNRRPYGFDWEDWGRIDALEVLGHATDIFRPDPARIYLTGHSMGGHGAWYLGITYPDKFAAIAPCAGYPDLGGYGSRGRIDPMEKFPKYAPFKRAVTYGRTLQMLNNLKQSGVFVFHGSDDRTVSPEQARLMRKLLGEFHSDFTYYEFPGGGHWFGTESMDWPPIFDYFRLHTIPKQNDVREIDFTTASPGISASDYWLRVEQQVTPCEFTNIIAVRDADTIFVEKTDNAALLVFDLPALDFASNTVRIDIGEQQIPVPAGEKAYLAFDGKEWKTVSGVDTKQRYSGRYGGGFKFAFDHNVVLVYATGGTPVENELYLNKARYDAETFYYRGNGSFDVIPDTEFTLEKYAGRNVVVYGNRNNNRAWNLLLKNSPIQVSKDAVTAGAQSWKGDDLGAYFLYPHPQNDVNFVGVVAGTGETGIRGASLNNYLQPITGFPEIMIFRADMLRTGLDGLEHAGFYNNNWEL